MYIKLFNRAAKKHSRSNLRSGRFVTYDKAKNILLLFESDGKNDIAIENIVKTLEKAGKNVLAYGFFNSKSSVVNYSHNIKLFNKKNTDLMRKPDRKILNEIKSSNFDLLIDLSRNTLTPLLYLSLFAHATMKISSKMTDPQLSDFILDINKNSSAQSAVYEQFVFDEIIFYLKSIQTTD